MGKSLFLKLGGKDAAKIDLILAVPDFPRSLFGSENFQLRKNIPNDASVLLIFVTGTNQLEELLEQIRNSSDIIEARNAA